MSLVTAVLVQVVSISLMLFVAATAIPAAAVIFSLCHIVGAQ